MQEERTSGTNPDRRTTEGKSPSEEIEELKERLRRTEQALQVSESRFLTFVENSLTAVCVHKDGLFVYVNERFVEMFGYRRDEILGTPFWELMAPEYRDLVRQRGIDRLEGKQPVAKYEIRALRKTGEELFIIAWFSVIDYEGAPAILGHWVDITDWKRAEEALKESEERFRTLFESAPDCIFIKDAELKYTHVNPAMLDLFGKTASDLIGATDEDLFGRRVGAHLNEVDARVLSGEPVEAEHTRLVNGVPIAFHDIRVPMRNSAGKTVGLFGIARNITERKRRSTPSSTPAGETLSPIMAATLAKARAAAEKRGMVLLLGESGAGKDYLARYIHDNSPRRDGPYFGVNCAALPPELAESELFGHEPGAFTGVVGRKRGLLELAEGGTLLLNEIGDLPLPLQAKLLSFLDSRSFTRVGGEKVIPVDARLLVATNKDLAVEVEEGRFRKDLFYRINVLSITVPPLRERREDIPTLVRSLLTQLAHEMQLPETPAPDADIMEALVTYDWPGNVRELRNVLERELMLWRGGPIRLTATELQREEGRWSYTVEFPSGRTIHEVSDEVKRSVLREALRRTGGNKARAARMLGITRYALLRMLRSVGEMVR